LKYLPNAVAKKAIKRYFIESLPNVVLFPLFVTHFTDKEVNIIVRARYSHRQILVSLLVDAALVALVTSIEIGDVDPIEVAYNRA
jgi:hypothetical protein